MNGRYNDIKSQLAALKRKSGTTLLSAPLKSILTTDVIMQGTGGMTPSELFINTDYLKTIVVVVNKSQDKVFLSTYEKINPVNDENGNVMYPTVPRSARRIIEDKDGYVLFTLIILKKYEKEIIEIFKEKHFHIRDYDIEEQDNSTNELRDEEKIAKFENDERNMKSNIIKWCRPHFSDMYQTWIHLKVMRVYIESILRYGLPPKFIPMVLKVRPKMEKRLEKILLQKYEHLGGKIRAYDKDVSAANIIAGNDATNYPFVCINIERLS